MEIFCEYYFKTFNASAVFLLYPFVSFLCRCYCKQSRHCLYPYEKWSVRKSVFMRITHICNGNLKWMPQFVAIYLHFCVVEKFPERYNLTTTRRWYCNKSSTIQNNCRTIEDKVMCMCSCTLNVCVCEGLRFSVYQYWIRPMAKYIHNRDR